MTVTSTTQQSRTEIPTARTSDLSRPKIETATKENLDNIVNALGSLKIEVDSKTGQTEIKSTTSLQMAKAKDQILLNILDNKVEPEKMTALIDEANFQYFRILNEIYLNNLDKTAVEPWKDPSYISQIHAKALNDLHVSPDILKLIEAFETVASQIPYDMDTTQTKLQPILKLWLKKREHSVEIIKTRLDLERQISSIPGGQTYAEIRHHTFKKSAFSGLKDRLTYGNWGYRLFTLGALATAGYIGYRLFKKMKEKIGEITGWADKKITELKGDTSNQIMRTILGSIGISAAGTAAILAIHNSEAISAAWKKDGISGLLSLFSSKEDKLPPEVKNWMKNKKTELQTKAGEKVTQVAGKVGVSAETQANIKSLAEHPDIKENWGKTKSVLKGALTKIGISDSTFELLDTELDKILEATGYTPGQIKSYFEGTALDMGDGKLPDWISKSAKIGGLGLLTYGLINYLGKTAIAKKLGIGPGKLMLILCGLYFILKVSGSKVPVADEIIPKQNQDTIAAFAESKKVEKYLEIINKPETKTFIDNTIASTIKYGDKMFCDISKIPGMPSLRDIKNLNPLMLIGHMMQEELTTDDIENALRSGTKIGFAYFIFNKLKGKTTLRTGLKGIVIFMLYCSWQESKKIDEIPNDILSKDGLLYIFKGIDDTFKYGNDFIDTLKKNLSEHEKTRPMVSEIDALKDRHDITPLSYEWFTIVGAMLHKYGDYRIILKEGSFALIGTAGEIICNTFCNVWRSLGLMAEGAISEGTGNTLSHGVLELGRTSVPFVVIGSVLTPDHALMTAKTLGWTTWGLSSSVVGHLTLKGIKYAFRAEEISKIVNGEVVKETGRLKIISVISKKTQSLKNTFKLTKPELLKKGAGIGKVAIVKFVRGFGWYVAIMNIGEGARDISTARDIMSTNQSLGETKLDKGLVELEKGGFEAIMLIKDTKKFQSLIRLIKGGAVASGAGVVTIPAALTGLAITTLVEMSTDVIIEGFESGEEILKRSEDFRQESRGNLIHKLFLDDTLNYGDLVLSNSDDGETSKSSLLPSPSPEELKKSKHRTRREICETLILKEMEEDEEQGTDVEIPYRLRYLEILTNGTFHFQDENQCNLALRNSRIYYDMMLNSIIQKQIQKKSNQPQQYTILMDSKAYNILDFTVRRSRDINFINKLLQAYIEQQKKDLVKDSNDELYIPEICMRNLDKLSEEELLYYWNLIDLFTRTKAQNKDNVNVFKFKDYLQSYVEKIRFVYAQSEYINTNDIKFEKRLIAFADTMMGLNNSNSWREHEQVDYDPIAFAVYELATGFGYTGEGDVESLRNYFIKDSANYKGIYWQNGQWYLAEQGDYERDDPYGNNGEATITNIIERIKRNKGNILSYKSDTFLDAGKTNYEARKSQEQWIADRLKKGLDRYKTCLNTQLFNAPPCPL